MKTLPAVTLSLFFALMIAPEPANAWVQDWPTISVHSVEAAPVGPDKLLAKIRGEFLPSRYQEGCFSNVLVGISRVPTKGQPSESSYLAKARTDQFSRFMLRLPPTRPGVFLVEVIDDSSTSNCWSSPAMMRIDPLAARG